MMFKLLKSAREIIKLIELANKISDQVPENTPKFGFLLTNRSFLVPAIGLIINILVILSFPALAPFLSMVDGVPAEELANWIIGIVSFGSILWSVIERKMTTAKVVLTKKQAEKAVAEVVGDDELAKALRAAIES